jgi:transposase
MARTQKPGDEKSKRLKEYGAFNPHPEKVTEGMFSDPKFDFFDPHDLVQVKYEMLRTVDKEGKSVKQASEAYGFSRPAFYQAQAQLKKSGVSGLIRKRPGPRSSHKITDEVLTFIEEETQEGEPLRSRKLALLIKEKFGKDVHPRSIERAIARRKKRNKDGSPAYLH